MSCWWFSDRDELKIVHKEFILQILTRGLGLTEEGVISGGFNYR